MKRLAVIAGLYMIGLSACTSDAKKRAMDANAAVIDSTGVKGDVRFAVEAADGGMLEIELGRLAQYNAAADVVKVFGAVMMEDHTRMEEQLKVLTDAKSFVLPAALGRKHKKIYDKLAEKKGKDFDKAYISMMVEDHEDDIRDFSEEAEKGKDTDLKSWAARQRSILEDHLQMAKRTDTTLRALYRD
jgi:putative membrane protein